MLTIKNGAGCGLAGEASACGSNLRPAIVVVPVVLLSGCTPSGPRALLEGKRLVDKGQYPQAIQKLKAATTLLGGTNAVAWEYLGLAYQYSGEVAEAEWAYQRALALNHDLSEVRFNLGCLWLAQNKLEAAKGSSRLIPCAGPTQPKASSSWHDAVASPRAQRGGEEFQ